MSAAGSGWFAREEAAAAGATRVWEPAVHRWFRGNAFVVRGRDRALVVDGCCGLAPLRPAIADLLGGLPTAFVATHGHADHVGAAHEFAERWIHRAEAAALEGDETATLTDRLRALGPDALAALPRPGFDLARFAAPRATATGFLDEGDRIDLGERTLRVLHLPGHSPGSIGLLDEAAGALFAGDAIYEGVLVDDLPGSDRAAYRATMRRLAGLPGVALALGGHNAPVSGDRLREIANGYAAGGGPAPPPRSTQ